MSYPLSEGVLTGEGLVRGFGQEIKSLGFGGGVGGGGFQPFQVIWCLEGLTERIMSYQNRENCV